LRFPFSGVVLQLSVSFSDCSLFLYLLGFIPGCDDLYGCQLFWTPFSLYEKHAMPVLDFFSLSLQKSLLFASLFFFEVIASLF